jgi:hypothetical protein
MTNLTLDAEWWCVTTCIHETTKEDGNVSDFRVFEDWGILNMELVKLRGE